MKHNLSRPCENCPFRNDLPRGYLTQARVRSIASSLFEGKSFACHKTLNRASNDDEEDPEDDGENDDVYDAMLDPGASSCAGSEIFLLKQGRSTQMGRIAERLGMAKRLDEDAPVCGSLTEMLDVHDRGNPKRKRGHHCEIVNGDCEAPAGYGFPNGGGVVSLPPPEAGVTLECRCCGQWVCRKCSKPDPRAAEFPSSSGRLCDDCCDDEERFEKETPVTEEPVVDRKPTPFQLRVLKFIADAGGKTTADAIGMEIWPNLKGGPANGGPSRQQCAANWQLGKMQKATGWIRWDRDNHVSVYSITAKGSRVLACMEGETCRKSELETAISTTSARNTRTGDSPSRGKRSKTPSTRRGRRT